MSKDPLSPDAESSRSTQGCYSCPTPPQGQLCMPEGRQVLQSFKSATDGAQKVEQGLPGTTAFGSRGRRKDTTTRRQKPS